MVLFMTLDKDFFKIIFAFVKAPICLAILLIIIWVVYSSVENGFIVASLDILSFILITIFTLLVSYINLIIFGVPGYFVFKRYDLFYTKIPLYFSFIIGFVEGFIITSGGQESSIMLCLIFGFIFAFCAVIVGYCLHENLKKIIMQS
jgi:hypothetical protein